MSAPTTPDDTPEGAPDAASRIKEEIRRGDVDARIYRHILRREQRPDSLPDDQDILAMGLPLNRLLDATVLFQDYAASIRAGGAIWDDAPRAAGLDFLADAMNRDAVRLYRLLHGAPPDRD